MNEQNTPVTARPAVEQIVGVNRPSSTSSQQNQQITEVLAAAADGATAYVLYLNPAALFNINQENDLLLHPSPHDDPHARWLYRSFIRECTAAREQIHPNYRVPPIVPAGFAGIPDRDPTVAGLQPVPGTDLYVPEAPAAPLSERAQQLAEASAILYDRVGLTTCEIHTDTVLDSYAFLQDELRRLDAARHGLSASDAPATFPTGVPAVSTAIQQAEQNLNEARAALVGSARKLGLVPNSNETTPASISDRRLSALSSARNWRMRFNQATATMAGFFAGIAIDSAIPGGSAFFNAVALFTSVSLSTASVVGATTVVTKFRQGGAPTALPNQVDRFNSLLAHKADLEQQRVEINQAVEASRNDVMRQMEELEAEIGRRTSSDPALAAVRNAALLSGLGIQATHSPAFRPWARLLTRAALVMRETTNNFHALPIHADDLATRQVFLQAEKLDLRDVLLSPESPRTATLEEFPLQYLVNHYRPSPPKQLDNDATELSSTHSPGMEF